MIVLVPLYVPPNVGGVSHSDYYCFQTLSGIFLIRSEIFPVEIAIALTGIVHFFNNVFKLFLVGKNADKKVLIRFGIPAVIASFIGAYILLSIPDVAPLFEYDLLDKHFQVYPVKFIISVLLIIFAAIDLVPKYKRMEFGKDKLPLGGFLSGFFGGLSGNQGALRTAFLIKAGLTKEAFIGTAVVVSTFVDFTRIGVYATRMKASGIQDNYYHQYRYVKCMKTPSRETFANTYLTLQ